MRLVRVLVAVAIAACALALAPSLASAAPSLSISVEPGIPAKGKPFNIILRGKAESAGGASWLKWSLSAGRAACGSTAALESAGDDDSSYTKHIDGNLAFDERLAYAGGSGLSSDLKNGLKVGKYHLCGYLEDTMNEGTTLLASRLDFTVGGTCASSTARVSKYAKAVTRANKALKRAKRAYKRNPSARNATRLRKAKAKVRKAKRSLKSARSDRKALC